ncbi:LOB domain-containing protein 2-like [Andrographis paniculata]|uniref:LOB domain-containing protein 2-like n=1 Tax=Andrographis paniculata TaxID=175694 RepID=UPI0021E757B7|nr:LOB domain-containing protein 2-like [Andrographis paniculata]
MQRANGTSACASCKHQRKKCIDKCVLAPFFPVDRTREFQAVHKVFGVSNITKIVTNLKEEDRRRAVDSLIWEALCRAKDPILGPYGEYHRVCEELRLYKNQYQILHHVVPSTQGNVVYKGAATAAHGLVGWGNNANGNGKVVAGNGGGGGGASAGVSVAYNNNSSGFHTATVAAAMRAESDNGSALILPEQHLRNGFNQHYFLNTGQYNPMDAKSVESTLWEGSS